MQTCTLLNKGLKKPCNGADCSWCNVIFAVITIIIFGKGPLYGFNDHLDRWKTILFHETYMYLYHAVGNLLGG